jgi:predicted phosphodiesterase
MADHTIRAMRIGLIGDLHANLPALQATLEDATRIGADAVYCVGDVVGRGPHPNEVVDLLRRLEIPTVQGNWDEAVSMDREQAGSVWAHPEAERAGLESLAWTASVIGDEQRTWLRSLPTTLRVDLGGGRTALLFHGSPMRQSEYLWADRPSRVFARIASDEGDDLFGFGHTHEAFHRVVGQSHFVAVGSVGCGSDGDARARYAVVYIGQPDVAIGFRAVDYDHEPVLRDLGAVGLPIDLMRQPPVPHPIPAEPAVTG